MPRKKRKQKKNIPIVKNAISSKADISKISAAIGVAKEEKGATAYKISFDAALAEKFIKALPEKDHSELRLWLEDFSSLGSIMKDRVKEIETLKKNIEEDQFRLLEKREDLEKQKKKLKPQLDDLKKNEKKIKKEQGELLKLRAELAQKEQDLEERELYARSGFAKEREVSLSEFKDEINNLEKEKSRLQRSIVEAKSTLAETLKDKEEELAKKELELQSEKTKLKRKERQLDRQWKEIENEHRDMQNEIDQAIHKERDDCSHLIKREEERSKRAFLQLDKIQSKLDQYKNLEQDLEGQSPKTLLDELDKLRADNRDFKKKLADNDTGLLEDENESLKEQVRHNERRLKEVEPELSKLRGELSRQHLGVMDKQILVEEKKVLEKHKQVLTAQLNDLSTRIDQLTESQQAQSAFPALSSMDQGQYETKPQLEDVPDLEEFALELQRRIAYAENEVVLYYKLEDIQLLLGGLAMSQLHIFQGISGTGKTSLAKAFAKAMGGQCTDIAVQAGWRDRDDLLGHYNAFEKRFYEKDCLQGLYQAQTARFEDRCNIILLDELNLSRPEQYFAEFLSALEKNNPNERLITLAEAGLANAPKLLVENRKIKVPENVWFIGTANHDETTNELADKTYDRSHVMVLPRHEEGEKLERIEHEQFSYSSLRKQFKQAQNVHRKAVEDILEALKTSTLTEVLESDFDIGWGNRFERQALQFIPVVMAAGGTEEMALDHLLATRVFRHGKVTARYDISVDALETVKDALLGIKKGWSPNKCLDLIEKDKKNKERGV